MPQPLSSMRKQLLIYITRTRETRYEYY